MSQPESKPIGDGGPAFPATPALDVNGNLLRPADIGQPGMTLLDWFAGKSLAGIANAVASSRICSGEGPDPEDSVRWAYDFAEAMLAEKQRRAIK